jgi:hypothetical protein
MTEKCYAKNLSIILALTAGLLLCLCGLVARRRGIA